MTLKTSLIITGDSSVAKSAVDSFTQSVDRAASSAGSAAAPIAALDKAQQGAAQSARDVADAASVVSRAQTDLAQTAASATASAREVSSAHGEVARSSGLAGQAQIVLQSAIRKTADQYAAGAPLATIFAEHIGTVAEVLELYARSAGGASDDTKKLIDGSQSADVNLGELAKTATEGAEKFKGFGGVVAAGAEFLAGPWGVAVSIAAAVLPSLIGKLLETETAADSAKDALKGFADYENSIGNFIDKTTGKLVDQNAALVQNALLLRKKAADDAAKASVDYGNQGFDLARKAASVTVAGGGTVPMAQELTDPKVQAALDKANGSVVMLSQNLNALASTDPRYKELASSVADLATKSAFANKTFHEQAGALSDLNTAAHGGTVLTADLVNRQIQLATANDAASKATARLSIAQARRLSFNGRRRRTMRWRSSPGCSGPTRRSPFGSAPRATRCRRSTRRA